MKRDRRTNGGPFRGVSLVLAMLATTLSLGVITLAIDAGNVVLLRAQLQVAADAAARAAAATGPQPRGELFEAARRLTNDARAGGIGVELPREGLEVGVWNAAKRAFYPTAMPGNAVRVTVQAGDSARFAVPAFSLLLGKLPFSKQASAVAATTPRDIVLVVDLSGAMNDLTEPCWATDALNTHGVAALDHDGAGQVPGAGDQLMCALFEDFGFGDYPGELEPLGHTFGVSPDRFAYLALIDDQGPLASNEIPAQYQILPGDTSLTRKRKAYSAIIDRQLARLMPSAAPRPDSRLNYEYWESYLDYIVEPVPTTDTKPLKLTVGARLGSECVPPLQSKSRIDRFNNPNLSAFPAIAPEAPQRFRNHLGYVTYTQFLLDHGRDVWLADNRRTPPTHSLEDEASHVEATSAGDLRFPPRTQPMHDVRLSLIEAIWSLRQTNAATPNVPQKDRVAIVTFDSLQGGSPVVALPLTTDYEKAVSVCAGLRASSDRGPMVATQPGLALAASHLKSQRLGGHGRHAAEKVVVLLTAAKPDLHTLDVSQPTRLVRTTVSKEHFDACTPAVKATMEQVARMRTRNMTVHAVGIGPGADLAMVRRLAALGGTGHYDTTSTTYRRPGEYRDRLTTVLTDILTNSSVQITQ